MAKTLTEIKKEIKKIKVAEKVLEEANIWDDYFRKMFEKEKDRLNMLKERLEKRPK